MAIPLVLVLLPLGLLFLLSGLVVNALQVNSQVHLFL
jgi:lysophosphatidic acid acyltransferase/lysophosphatidylinositol acyltransferase